MSTSEAKRRNLLAPLATSLELPPGFVGMSSTSRLSALLDLPNLPAVIRRLRGDELYFLIRDIGVEDAFDLMAYATPDQRRTFMDLDMWVGSRFDSQRMDQIVEQALQVDHDFAKRMVQEMDPEAIVLRIFSVTQVLTQEEAETVDLGNDAVFQTPDNIFVLACENHDEVPGIKRLMELLYAENVDRAHQLLQAGRRDTPSSLEDMAWNYRQSRLQDLGFPSDEDRFAIYEPIDVKALRKELEIGRALALPLAATPVGLFFWECLGASAGERDPGTIVSSLLALGNRVLAARSRDISEEGGWLEASRHALSLVSIGLEDLANGDAEIGSTLLSRLPGIVLFRVGMEAIRPAHVAARRIIGDVGGLPGLDLFEPGIGEPLRAVAAFPPSFCEMLTGGSGWRDFQGLDDVIRVQRVVEQARAVVTFARNALGFVAASAGHGSDDHVPTFANVTATAWARRILDGSPSLLPLDGEAVGKLRVTAFDGDRIRAALRPRAEEVSSFVDNPSHVQPLLEFLDRAVSAVEESLSGLDPSQPVETRFLGNCILFKE
jgi:hypothetical protein